MVENLVLVVVVVAIMVVLVRAGKKKAAAGTAAGPQAAAPGEKAEALFVSMFPELQPHFHPEKLVRYVGARRGRTPARGGFTWKVAPGFDGPAVDIRFVGEREECALVDDAGKVLAKFRFETHADGGVLRVGAGKLTVDLRNDRDPAVRYWHPEREFKWTRRGGWRFKTPVADRPFAQDDRGTSWSDSSSSSGSSRTAAAAFAGLGGTFDGGGASAGWDGAPASAGADEGGTGAAATADSDAGSGSETGGDSGGDSGSDSGGDSGSDAGSTSY